ncbi:MAG TPA: hypothetical protein VEK56_10035 [Vicinamibacterales bacterium]|nr:hypothetical protein [Vicinamibacterales bacterium]
MVTELVVRPDSPVEYEQFGRSVAMSGGFAIVGAGNGAFAPGAAYVFAISGSSWIQQARLEASDKRPFDKFGQAVAITVITRSLARRAAAMTRRAMPTSFVDAARPGTRRPCSRPATSRVVAVSTVRVRPGPNRRD